MELLVVFAYEVGPAERASFERAYGPDGEWAAFFRGSEGHLSTDLHRSEDEPPRYLVLDRWTSAEAYEGFLERHRDEYERRSRATEALYRTETLIGRFLRLPPAAE